MGQNHQVMIGPRGGAPGKLAQPLMWRGPFDQRAAQDLASQRQLNDECLAVAISGRSTPQSIA